MKKRYYVAQGAVHDVWVHETTKSRRALFALEISPDKISNTPARAISTAIAELKATIRKAKTNEAALRKLAEIYAKENKK